MSFVCILIALKINYSMSIEYLNASGKTQALFGITHLNRFYFGIIGLSGLIIGIISLIKGKVRNLSLISILLAVASIIFTFLEVWKIFI